MDKSSKEIQIEQLGHTNLLKWIFWLFWDWSLIIMAIVAIDKIHNWFVWVLAMILIGSRQHAIAILGHDGTHLLAAQNRRINDFLTNLFCFLPFGVTLNSYRVVHLQHHNYLGTDKDPELDFKKAMGSCWDLPTTKRAIVLRFFKDLAALGWSDSIEVMKSLPIKRSRDYAYLFIFWLFAIMALFMIGKLWIIPVWFIAIFLPNWAVFRLRIWSEHVGTMDTHRLKASWWQRWLFLPHNTWYHYEHHKWPWVPFYNLSKAREHITDPSPASFSNLMSFFSNVRS